MSCFGDSGTLALGLTTGEKGSLGIPLLPESQALSSHLITSPAPGSFNKDRIVFIPRSLVSVQLLSSSWYGGRFSASAGCLVRPRTGLFVDSLSIYISIS